MYKRNFLDKVIIRVDFAKPLPNIEKSLPKNLSEKALALFPIPEPKKRTGKEYQITPKGLRTQEVEKQEWYYYGKNREKALCIASDCMFMTYETYRDKFENLRDAFMVFLEVLCKEYKELEFGRLGIRYIDKIEFKEGNFTVWDDYINKKLLSIFEVADERTKISRAFHMLELNYGDMKLKFQYGMPNPDFPAPIKRKLFVLDTDAYLDQLQTKEDVESNLTKFHDKLILFFEQSITDKLRRVMNA